MSLKIPSLAGLKGLNMVRTRSGEEKGRRLKNILVEKFKLSNDNPVVLFF